jgi:hypothetical protein
MGPSRSRKDFKLKAWLTMRSTCKDKTLLELPSNIGSALGSKPIASYFHGIPRS